MQQLDRPIQISTFENGGLIQEQIIEEKSNTKFVLRIKSIRFSFDHFILRNAEEES